MRRVLLMALGLFLAGCGADEHQDLKEELKKLTVDMRGRVDPLPVVKPYEPVPYKAFDLPDPFGPTKIELVTKQASVGSGIKPDLDRPKEPLEAFPLESLKVVGMLQQGKQIYALVRAEASVYRVKKGNFLGQNFGLITNITDTQVQLRELVQDAGGDWTERVSALQLQEAGGK
jgi:type IV pilus assembly protein PilP